MYIPKKRPNDDLTATLSPRSAHEREVCVCVYLFVEIVCVRVLVRVGVRACVCM